MKRLQGGMVFLLMVIFTDRCGVHVGNAMRTYSSPYGYSVTYSDRVQPKESEDRTKVGFDNRHLLTKENDFASTLTITAEPNRKVSTREELEKIAKESHFSGPIQDANIPGAVAIVRGFARDKVSAHQQYLLFSLKRKELIRITLNVGEAGDGMSLILPIADSFRID